ncbi:precorrin-3B C(17)-methyltransferase [Clostridium hydrogenum]|uniref:precorrin-3B C(17)-methyltransferase n=1 Tax=Clostridium hydrogenum TaxID=2855764 RepID=UPI002E304DD4|nr:precorrin-3B C(17)-methyltransferase [Clostridium hydrogenum]
MAKLYVIGIGPGSIDNMTLRAVKAIEKSKVVVGYSFYIEILKELLEKKEVISTGMRGEIERCKIAIDKVREGIDTAIISTGDAGLYGMAGPILELASDIEVEVIPGVTSAFAGAAEIGAPIMHDFCTISLSDLLTPYELIQERIKCAAKGDFVIAIYNPRSKGRENYLKNAVKLIMEYKSPNTPVGIIKNAGRAENEKIVTTLSSIDYEFVDMKTVVIIGNKNTYIKAGKMITPRGYKI